VAGRTTEVELVRRFSVSSDPPNVLVIEGEGGMGKTCLLDLAVSAAFDAGIPVGRSGGEKMLADRPLGTLLRALAGVVGEGGVPVRWPSAPLLGGSHWRCARGTATDAACRGVGARAASGGGRGRPRPARSGARGCGQPVLRARTGRGGPGRSPCGRRRWPSRHLARWPTRVGVVATASGSAGARRRGRGGSPLAVAAVLGRTVHVDELMPVLGESGRNVCRVTSGGLSFGVAHRTRRRVVVPARPGAEVAR